MTSPLVVPVGCVRVRLEAPVPLLLPLAARSVIPVGGGVGVAVGVGGGVGVAVGGGVCVGGGVAVGVGVGVGVGVTVPTGFKAISIVTLALAPLMVACTVPVAPVVEKSSWDISEVVEELLLVLHSCVKPVGTFTEVAITMPA